MKYTYDPTLSSPKDMVRMLTGDRNVPDKASFSDEEIEALLVQRGNNPYCVAVVIGESILSAGRGLVEKAVDDLRLRWSDNPKSGYAAHINTLREKCAAGSFGTRTVFRMLGSKKCWNG